MLAGAAARLRYKKRPANGPNTKNNFVSFFLNNFIYFVLKFNNSRHGSLLTLLPLNSPQQPSTSTSTPFKTVSNSTLLLNTRNRSGSVPLLKYTLVNYI